MRNIYRYSMAIVLILAIAFFISGCSAEKKNVQKVPFNGQTETVSLSVNEDGFYEPRTITVKAGTKLRIEGDPQTLKDYMDTIVVDDYDVRKRVSEGDNVLEFVADMPGTYNVHCANGMGDGKLVVTP